MNCHEASVLAAALRVVRGAGSPQDRQRVRALKPASERVQLMALACGLGGDHCLMAVVPSPDVLP